VDKAEIDRRKPVWVALSDLWLDTEIDENWAKRIAEVVADSGYSEKEVDDIFNLELAPFLGPNHRVVAGEWTGFDPEWVCEEARKRMGNRSMVDRIASRAGWNSYAAREPFDLVKKLAFGEAESL